MRHPEATAPVGDATKARQVLGWEPTTDFRGVIAEMIAEDVRLAALEASGDAAAQ